MHYNMWNRELHYEHLWTPHGAAEATLRSSAQERARSCREAKNVHRPLGASSEDLVRHCLRLHLRDAVDLLELLEELGLGRVARLLPRAEGVERDLVRGRVE